MGLRSRVWLLCVASCVWALQAEDVLVERRAPDMGFMGMRGKKRSDDKRAPSMGFSAMRGKKDSFYDSFDVNPEYNRAATMGFTGVWGKKGIDPEYDSEDELFYEKRGAPSMGSSTIRGKEAPPGFIGMRGKRFHYTDNNFRDNDLWAMVEVDKRVPFAGIFNTREKKMPQRSGFFGTWGKKGPLGFVGMRGKKATPSGFFGVRGKRDSTEDIDSLLSTDAK